LGTSYWLIFGEVCTTGRKRNFCSGIENEGKW